MSVLRSRYAAATLARVEGRDGVFRPTIYTDVLTEVHRTFSYHAVVDGERIEHIANRFYQDPGLWWKIAEANRGILYFGELEPGTLLKVPHL